MRRMSLGRERKGKRSMEESIVKDNDVGKYLVGRSCGFYVDARPGILETISGRISAAIFFFWKPCVHP